MSTGYWTTTIAARGDDIEEEIEVEVEFSYSGGSAPVTSGPPEACDPGSDPEIEITKAYDPETGADVVLTDAERETIEQNILENYEWDDGSYDDRD